MAAFTFFRSFKEALAEKKHDLGADTFSLALCSAANAPSESLDAVLADVTQIAYTNLGARTLTITSSQLDGTTYRWIIADKVLTASGGSVAPFRYVLVYNDTATNDELVGWYDYLSDLTLLDTETLTLDLDGVNGLISLA